MPESFWHDPLMYQGGADAFIPPHSPIRLADEAWGIDLEGELAVITDDVPMGATPAEAASHIQLLMLVNDVSLRNLIPGELAKGFGFYQSKPSSSFAGGGDAGRAGRNLARRQGASASGLAYQR